MAKIISKADLTIGTNLKLHIADKGATDITITDNGDGTGTIVSAALATFATTTELAGVVNRAIVIDDIIVVSHTNEAGNEGARVTVTAVTDLSITYADIDTLVTEASGSDINLISELKTYQFLEAGALTFIDGVQGIVLASEMVDLWDVTDLDIYDPAFTSIEPRAKSMASINGWEPHDIDTLKAIRDMALEIRPDSNTAATKIYASLRSGTLNAATDQFTFWPSTDLWDTAPTLAVTTGYINELVLIYDLAGTDNRFSNGTDWYTRCAENGKSIIMEQFELNYAEITPVSAANALDPKLADGAGTPYTSDATILAGGIWANVLYNLDVTGTYSGDVDGTPYDFTGYVEADSQTNETVHEKINYLWRQPDNINTDGTGATLRGDKQWPMTVFVGDGFTVEAYLLNYNAAQRNNLTVVDETDVARFWPTIFTLTVNAAALAVGGTFSVIHADTFGTSAAVYLQNETPADQKDVTIASSVSIVVAYSTYSVDGHTANTPLDLILTWNRPGFIEPSNSAFTLSSDTSVSITPTADPSYIA